MKSIWSLFTSSLLLIALMTGCGSSSQTFLNSLDVTTTTQNSSNFVNLSATVSMGSTTLAALTVPILDPHSQVTLGEVSLLTNSAKQELITLSINETALTSGNATLGGLLPNGEPLPPLLEAASGSVMGIPFLQNSRIYLGGDLKSKIIVGVAFGISALDPVTSGIGVPADVLFSNQFNAQIFGLAGLYTSPSAGDNGILVFGSYTPLVSAPAALSVNLTQAKTASRVALLSTGAGSVATTSASATPVPPSGEVKTSELTSNQENKIATFFMKKRVLKVQ